MELAQLGVQVLNLNLFEAGSSRTKRQGAAGIPADAVHVTDESLNDPHLRKHIVFVTRKHPTRCGYVGSGNPIHLSDSLETLRLLSDAQRGQRNAVRRVLRAQAE